VVEGGRRRDGATAGPLVARMPFPSTWRGVVAVPGGARGLSGSAEAAAFARLPPPAAGEAEAVAHLVLMGLLPALAEADLPAFGAALTDIQHRTGGWFSTLQGGRFAPGATRLVERMRAWGAHGVGQSSWGPAVYGLVEGDEACAALAARLRADLGPGGLVYHGAFPAAGARVWRGAGVRV
jgi:beta-RFAP synthase